MLPPAGPAEAEVAREGRRPPASECVDGLGGSGDAGGVWACSSQQGAASGSEGTAESVRARSAGCRCWPRPRRLDECEWIDAIVVVAPPEWEEPAILLAEEIGARRCRRASPGGDTRSASVRAGLAEVPEDALVILVHDAARPLAADASSRALLEALGEGFDGAVPGLPVADTVKRVRERRRGRDAGARRARGRADAAGLSRAGAAAAAEGEGRDRLRLARRGGRRARQGRRGDERLLKVTTPADLARVEALLAAEVTWLPWR